MGADKIMSSWLARNHPLAPARRQSAATDVSVQSNKSVNYSVAGQIPDDDKRDEVERLSDEGKLIEHKAGPQPSNRTEILETA